MILTEQEKEQAGWKKKSMSLFFHNGEIWFEHLDSMGTRKDLVVEKFQQDLSMIKRPSSSAYIDVNLYETEVDEQMLTMILYTLRDLDKMLRKVVFVGLNRQNQKIINKLIKSSDQPIPFQVKCMDDYQKSKEWLLP